MPDVTGPVNAVHIIGGVTVLMADSTIPGHDEGRLAPATLDWITETLSGLAPDARAVVALHHSPAVIHEPGKEHDGLRHPEELAALLTGDRRVLAVLTGHKYVPMAAVFAGRPLLVAPPMTWTGPVADHDRHATALPPQLALHFIDDRNLATQFLVLP
ncbi:phosphodiesterase [Streptomyces sp. NPDC050485]|uniref:phosphodiesterase n=1 Tax=Streptomyces sp. NPDC050485 TaxID=3365617 RepID=UPI0037ADF996